jgi:hypothetical protein
MWADAMKKKTEITGGLIKLSNEITIISILRTNELQRQKLK